MFVVFESIAMKPEILCFTCLNTFGGNHWASKSENFSVYTSFLALGYERRHLELSLTVFIAERRF